jgi:hypothetical protein
VIADSQSVLGGLINEYERGIEGLVKAVAEFWNPTGCPR